MLLDEIINRGRRFKGMISKIEDSEKLLGLMNYNSIRTVDTIKELEEQLSDLNIDLYIYISRVYNISFYDIRSDIEHVLKDMEDLIPTTVVKNDLEFNKLTKSQHKLYEMTLILSIIGLMENDTK